MHDQLFETLRNDHNEVKSLFNRLESTDSPAEKKKLLETIRKEILPHMIGEEQIVYPSLRNAKEAWDDALESFEEHHAAQLILRELGDLSPEDEHFRAKAAVLKEMVEHHIQEEEKEIFSDLKKNLSEKEAGDILEGFKREKELAKSKYPDIPSVTAQ